MPHGGYHGVVKVGNTIVQQGSPAGAPPGQGGQYNPDGYATEMAGSPAPSTTENIEKQIADKKKEIENLAFDSDKKGLATLQNIQNQQLNNLLIQQAQIEARNRILGKATPSQVDVDQGFGIVPTLRKADLTGFEGGPFGLNIPAFGATPSTGMSGVRTLKNPLTGEILFSTDPKNPGSRQDELLKARLGLTTPQYNTFISDLYSANPELYEEKFPLASGNLAQPILARLLEGGLGGVGSGIGSFIDSATGAIFKPRGGTVRPSDVGTPSDTGGVTSVIDASKANNNPFNLPSAFTGFYESDFYNPNAAGGQMIVPVTLPDGTVVRLPNTAVGEQFIQYLESIGVDSNLQDQTFKKVEGTPQPTGISKFDVDKFYASLPQYTQQGIMSPNLSRFTDALKMFPGMA
jgi:hypothetical protein